MSLFSSLNAEQKTAVTYGKGPLMIVAGAGTGKTTVITQRIVWLMDPAVGGASSPKAFGRALKPEEILALTFTDKAAAEMEDRVGAALPIGYRDLWISTFHALCERLLRTHALDIGLNDNFRVLTPTAVWALLKKHEARFDLDYYRPKGNPTKYYHALIRHFSRAKDEAVGVEEYLRFVEGKHLDRAAALGVPLVGIGGEELDQKRLHEIAGAYATYEQILRDENTLDFGDLLVWTVKLLQERPNILEQYRKQFQCIVVDEFQDTNWVQYELVKLLASPANNLTVVADDDQAIYRWRGASFSNVIQFKKDFPSACEVALVQNYRSAQPILDLAYQFIQKNNPNRLEARSGISKHLQSAVPLSGAIEHRPAATVHEEARMVVKTILEQMQESALSGHPLQWNDVAVLVRSNADADPFVRAFAASGIPYDVASSRGLYLTPIVLDTLAYLNLLDNYHESASVYRVLKMSVFAVADETIHTLLREARKKNHSLFEILRRCGTVGIPTAEQEKIAKLLAMIETHTALSKGFGPAKVVVAFFKDSGLVARWRAEGATPYDLQELSYAEQFYRIVEQYEREQQIPTITGIAELVRLSLEAGDEGALKRDDAGPEAVQVLTMHAAKGLEFRVVCIVSMVDRRFPTQYRPEPLELPMELMKEILPEGDWHLQEERRLMYVAITRAKEKLYFTSAQDYGGVRKKKPSLFLYELGLIQKEKSEVRSQKSEQSTFTTDATLPIPNIRYPISNLPSYFSFTQLKAFESCPLQYKFAHILKIPIEGRFTFSFGKSMHKTLEVFFQRMIRGAQQGQLFALQESAAAAAPVMEELLQLYEQSWLNEWYESAVHERKYYQEGKKILKEFYQLHQGHWPSPRYLEKPFTIKFGEFELRGVIDRVDTLADGANPEVEIIDYKTGRVPEGKTLPFEKKQQLLIYQLAVLRLTDEQPKLLSYYYLEQNKKMSFLGTPEELEKVEQFVVETIENIRTSDFHPTPDPIVCGFCDFRTICEFRKI
ncbi:UvrD-helicase domain-containing protein [Candidatus Uhrbacteria bacterium]|nr:UvrD-helicase domain-containing protein [Candidatus Uhrbacteria bacterium]